MNLSSDDSSGVWLDVIAAVDYLAAGPRPALTVWSALAEALDAWLLDRHDIGTDADSALPWEDPDPLRSTMEMVLRTVGGPGTVDGGELAAVGDAALQRWVADMAAQYNDGRSFAHPAPRAGWPAPDLLGAGSV